MAEMTLPNYIPTEKTGMEGLLPLIVGAALFGGRGGLFGNNNDAAAGAVTAATVNQAVQDGVQNVIGTQNQAQIIQDIHGTASVTQRAIADSTLSIQNTQLQGQIAAMQGQANIINSIDSHTNDISNELSRQSASIANDFAHVNAAIATVGAASALAAKDAEISALRNTQVITANTDANTATVLAAITNLKDSLPNARELALQSDLIVARDALNKTEQLAALDRGNVTVTNNINQNATQVAMQNQLNGLHALLTSMYTQQATAGNMNILGTQNGVVQTPVNVNR